MFGWWEEEPVENSQILRRTVVLLQRVFIPAFCLSTPASHVIRQQHVCAGAEQRGGEVVIPFELQMAGNVMQCRIHFSHAEMLFFPLKYDESEARQSPDQLHILLGKNN
ncbi:hypothetical protein AMECASPLE_007449 [Ameca splendens]|uniref:Uncharacterized protein n=1 Tax=Ameca splendens TaxID=208324 RepID=A0ABV1A731_9TELE